mgnify:CR=1 FL=1
MGMPSRQRTRTARLRSPGGAPPGRISSVMKHLLDLLAAIALLVIFVNYRIAANDLQHKLDAGLLAADKAAVAPQLIFNQQLDAWLAMLFVVLLYLVVGDMLRMAWRRHRGLSILPSSETPYVARQHLQSAQE